MTMHRLDVSPRYGVPAKRRTQPASIVSRASAADTVVCEWAADLDLGPAAAISLDAATSLAATGFVDFDSIETVHASSVSASWR